MRDKDQTTASRQKATTGGALHLQGHPTDVVVLVVVHVVERVGVRLAPGCWVDPLVVHVVVRVRRLRRGCGALGDRELGHINLWIEGAT